MADPVKVAVIYYSATGTVHGLAGHAAKTAESQGAAVRLRRVTELAPEEAIASNAAWVAHREATADIPEATMDDLEWGDAVLFGTPTRYGLPTAQLKQFIDQTGPLWQAGKLVNKVASSFTASATLHGGQETTIVALNNTFYHWGCVIVAPGYAEPSQFTAGNPYGASHVSTPDQALPGETQLEAVALQTRRAISVAAALKAAGLLK